MEHSDRFSSADSKGKAATVAGSEIEYAALAVVTWLKHTQITNTVIPKTALLLIPEITNRKDLPPDLRSLLNPVSTLFLNFLFKLTGKAL